MMKGIKMIVTDLDGTFFRNDKTVSDYTTDIFVKCRKNGIKLAFATARSSNTQIPVDLFDGFVKSNGAVVFAHNKIICDKSIPIQLAQRVLVAADNAGISIVAQTNERHCANFNLKEVTGYLDGEIIDFNTIDFEPQKIFAFISNDREIEVLRSNLSNDLYMNIARDDVAMVMNKEALKSKAVAALADYWGIAQTEIVAFGDDINDIDLLKFSGVSVAVGNAVAEVREITHHICDTNENDGVAKWIEGHIL